MEPVQFLAECHAVLASVQDGSLLNEDENRA
jgi:hypothetical protein